jgi:hypothetical protein
MFGMKETLILLNYFLLKKRYTKNAWNIYNTSLWYGTKPGKLQ